MKLTLSEIFEIPTAVIYDPDKFTSVSSVVIDSRKVEKGSLFVAVKGERFDGHDFVKEAVQLGATAVVIEKRKLRRYDELSVPIICVHDTTKALGDLASVWRNKLKAKVISLTGSNGKTSVKDFLKTLLSEKYKVFATEYNNNNHIGVPLTIFSANEKTEMLVLEHGTNHFGEIKYTADIAQPDVAFITNIGDSHLEYLVDRQGVLKEKAALLNVAADRGGTILVNSDDALIKKYAAGMYANKITYGFKGKPDIKGKILSYDDLGKAKILIVDSKRKIDFTLPLPGEANAKNILSAVAASLTAGLTKKEIINGIKKIKAVKGRLNLIEHGAGLLIDDTYNSNPNSVKAAVEVLRRIKKPKRRVLILGDMFELGKNAQEIHVSLAEEVKKLTRAELLCIGKNMKYLAEAVKDKAEAKHFRTRESLKKYLRKNDYSDAVVLVKGSRGMKMEEFVEVLREKD